MKYQILRLITLFILLISISSCFEGRWARYGDRSHYNSRKHKSHIMRFHNRHNGDW